MLSSPGGRLEKLQQSGVQLSERLAPLGSHVGQIEDTTSLKPLEHHRALYDIGLFKRGPQFSPNFVAPRTADVVTFSQPGSPA